MPDDVAILPSFEPEAVPVATDEVGSRHYQWMKPAFGPDGTATPVEDTNAGRLPVGGASLGNPDAAAAATDTETTSLLGLFKRLLQRTTTSITSLGLPADAAAATDTEATGLIGLFKRALQRITTVSGQLTTLAAQLPTALTTNGGALKTGSGEAVLTHTVLAGNFTGLTGIDLAGLRNWGLMIPAEFDGTQIQFYACDTLGGTYLQVYDITNSPVTLTVAASRYYDIPGELMGVRFLKIWCVTVQATTSTVFTIVGKS
jgi:hypothetical protein